MSLPSLGLRPRAELLISQLFGLEDNPLARLTVAEQMGCRVVASVVASPDLGGLSWLNTAWIDPEGGVNFRTDAGQKGCGTSCYAFRLTPTTIATSSVAVAAELFGPNTKEQLFVAREVAAQHLEDFARADSSTDVLSPYGIGMGSVRVRFAGHDLPAPVIAAIENVGSQR
jgi:hypothetical protein